jgi:hypothetical protein
MSGLTGVSRPPHAIIAVFLLSRGTDKAWHDMIEVEQRDPASYLDAFWSWVSLLADGDYGSAVDALYWDRPKPDPEAFRESVETFFGGPDPWTVVIPNQRLIDEINSAAEIDVPSTGRPGWFMATIPLTTRPQDPKDDAIPLMGLAVSFFVRDVGRAHVMEFEIFHA